MIFARVKAALSALPLLVLACFFLAFPNLCAESFADGLRLCAQSLLPALFPFFVISTLILGSRNADALALPLKPVCRALGLYSHKAPMLLLLGWLGGYTALAAGLAQCCKRNEISAQEAARLLPAGVICSPGFTAAVGGLMLGSPSLGILFYASSLCAGIVCGLGLRLLCGPCQAQKTSSAPSGESPGLAGAIGGAVQSSLQVCGTAVFFCMILAFCEQFALSPFLRASLAGLLEISSGCRAWAQLPGIAAVGGCCGCLSILSLSVWCQLKALSDECYTLRFLALTRLPHLVLSWLFLRIFLHFLPGAAPALNTLYDNVIVRRRLPGDRALLLFLFCCLVLDRLEKACLYKKSKGDYNK